ncbi:MAG: glycosyltransferase family 2 protein, partial [Comamonadaceae bacterium]
MEIRKVGRYAWRYGWAALAIVVVFVLLALTYDTVQDAKGTLMILLENGLLAAISSYLLIFLVLLIFRFALLLLYSFMDHLESLYKGRDKSAVLYREDSSLPMISLVVPAYNEGPVIQAAMRALLALDYPNYEIIVVDDGSTDDTYEKAMGVASESVALEVRVVTKRNGGKADALNTGMTLARGEFVLNMDGDTKLSPNALRACIRHFENPKVGAVAGNVKVINRENIWTRIQALEYVEGLAMARKAQSFGRVVNIIPGPLGMFRKSVLQQVGGYDRDTFAEDCDLTLKLLMRGWHIEYEPAAIAWVETPS